MADADSGATGGGAKADAGKDGKDQPAAGIGMDVQALKKLLVRSKKEAVNCALAQGDAKTGGLGLVLLDKIELPKQLMKSLKEQFPTSRSPCFGTASIDVDKDPKLVTFRVNRRVPGLDRRMRKSLKGTGFTKVEIQTGPSASEGE